MSRDAYEVIRAQSGDRGVMDVLSRSLRAMFVAGPGRVLVGGDFSNIEGRINAWLAGEQWKLDAFRAYDAGTGPDLYKLGYARAFGQPVEDVTKSQRQVVAKPMELASGFGGSVGAFLRFLNDVEPLVCVVRDALHGGEAWRRATEQYDRLKYHNGLSAEQWIAVKVTVNLWREANPRIVESWWAFADAALEAVETAARVETCAGRACFMAADGFLWIRIASGKLLAYANPRIVEKKDDWLVDEDGNAVPADEMSADEVELRIATGWELQEGKRRLAVCYDGVNQKTRAWGRQYLYGGLLCNNIVQATARELLRFALHGVEAAGYPVVMHCHDELVCEVAEHMGAGCVTSFEGLMSVLPPWLGGLPLAAKAWTDRRYVK